ncbi:B3 domain-containing protein Os01g0234100-like isoform X2 [Rhododendron vialii]|uniref:B3 domain-containing protein Os01g0234100-like isoform X2 n=1 Tax=Rhododendron vialii TaxID=182163 RepID=UPI00265F0E29|nr:B3 domain-containing protein Os01g0234100-like isoform X2 [Rhododendron vialii]
MAISRFTSSKPSPVQPSSTIKVNKKWEAKKKLARQRLADLETTTRKVIPDKPKKSTSESKGALISHDCLQTKSSAMDRALEVQAKLAPEFPSFVKLMLPSHVTGGFWLSFPKWFSASHLPKNDDIVTLLGESDKEYATKYLIDKNGLSGGWRGFSIAHRLLEGDVLVFQLIQPCKFKVYIVRANGFSEVDGAVGLLTLDSCVKPMDIGIEIYEKDVVVLDPLSRDIHQCDAQENKLLTLSTEIENLAEQSGNDSEDFGSELLEGIRFSEASVDFKDIKSIENFTILVDGLVIDSEIPPHLRIKYYELCCSQNAFLHDHLLEGLNFKLVSGIISETVNIADAIRASKLTTSRNNLTIWENTLKAFEKLGMNVGFLLARLDRLLSLVVDSEKVLELKRVERVRAEEEKKTLEVKLLDVKKVMKILDEEIEGLKGNNNTLESMFQKEAKAPW